MGRGPGGRRKLGGHTGIMRLRLLPLTRCLFLLPRAGTTASTAPGNGVGAPQNRVPGNFLSLLSGLIRLVFVHSGTPDTCTRLRTCNSRGGVPGDTLMVPLGKLKSEKPSNLPRTNCPHPRTTAAELRPCPRGTSLLSPVKRTGHSCSHPFPRPQRFLVVRVRRTGWQLPCG